MRNAAKNTKAKRAREQAIPIEPGSGNVFADLGLPHPEDRLAKAELIQCIINVITARKLTPVQAAAILGIDQPKASALLRGKFDGFSSDRLFRFLNALGQNVEIVIWPTRRAGERARMRVASH